MRAQVRERRPLLRIFRLCVLLRFYNAPSLFLALVSLSRSLYVKELRAHRKEEHARGLRTSSHLLSWLYVAFEQLAQALL